MIRWRQDAARRQLPKAAVIAADAGIVGASAQLKVEAACRS
jgi:hypothetical protein